MSVFKLNLRYKFATARLIDMAMRYGLNDRRVIKQSQKIDRLVVELQRRMA